MNHRLTARSSLLVRLALVLSLLTLSTLPLGCAQDSAPDESAAEEDAVSAAVQALESVDGYRYTLELDIETIDSRSTGKGTGVVSGADEMSEFESMGVEYSETGERETRASITETRLVDGEAYFRIIDPDAGQASSWTRPNAVPGTVPSATSRWLSLIERGLILEELGLEDHNGVSCHHVSMQIEAADYWAVVFGTDFASDSGEDTASLPEDMGPPIPLDVWIGADDSLPRRFLLTPPEDGLVDYSFSDWGAQQPIEAPLDVEPWPEDSGVPMDQPWPDN